MAYLSKEQYDRRRDNAARRMAANAEIETLTPEQHEFLDELCSMRHEIHCSGLAMFCCQSSDYSRLWDYIDNGDETLNGRARALGFDLQARNDSIDVPADDDWDWDDEYEDIDAAREACMQWLNEWNDEIEQFLLSVDKTYGTNYCPTGALRGL